jgi:hypothetical protein
MGSLLNLDQQTMFMVNALLLIVFAVAFAFAASSHKDRRYWALLVASNIVFGGGGPIPCRRTIPSCQSALNFGSDSVLMQFELCLVL